MKVSRAHILALVLGLGLSAVAAVAFDLLVLYPSRPSKGSGETILVDIPKGAGPARVAQALTERGIIDSPMRFSLWLRWAGGFERVRAGTFEVPDNAAPSQILAIISGPSSEKGIRVTIPEGFRLAQIGSALEGSGVIGERPFLEAATNPTRLAQMGIDAPTAEGYLFPDTYFFSRNTSPKKIIRRMFERMKRQYAEIAPNQPLDKDVLTLASIVQAEARITDEMPTIAGVYRNRMNESLFPSGLLQADPTVAYGCEPHIRPKAPSCLKYDGRIYLSHLSDEKNPYNTYQHPGLPPGPICAPGRNALRAALDPQEHDYLFFVAGGPGGRHVFSKTLTEHNDAVSAYRRSR